MVRVCVRVRCPQMSRDRPVVCPYGRRGVERVSGLTSGDSLLGLFSDDGPGTLILGSE